MPVSPSALTPPASVGCGRAVATFGSAVSCLHSRPGPPAGPGHTSARRRAPLAFCGHLQPRRHQFRATKIASYRESEMMLFCREGGDQGKRPTYWMTSGHLVRWIPPLICTCKVKKDSRRTKDDKELQFKFSSSRGATITLLAVRGRRQLTLEL